METAKPARGSTRSRATVQDSPAAFESRAPSHSCTRHPLSVPQTVSAHPWSVSPGRSVLHRTQYSVLRSTEWVHVVLYCTLVQSSRWVRGTGTGAAEDGAVRKVRRVRRVRGVLERCAPCTGSEFDRRDPECLSLDGLLMLLVVGDRKVEGRRGYAKGSNRHRPGIAD